MKLDVYMGALPVGWLSHDSASNQFAFDYCPDWLLSPTAFPLAPTLPLASIPDQTADSHSRAVRVFFENLLPEGQALDDAAATYSVSRHNVSGLLAVLGQETAGALRILLPAQGTVAQLPQGQRLVTKTELSDRIRQRNQIPFSIWDRKVRLSIAGYQDKLAVFQNTREEWFLVEGESLASTHILKPEPVNTRLAGLTSNEFFCMRLAQAMGLAVAPVRLHHVPEPVLLVKRFDREFNREFDIEFDRNTAGDEVRRLPAIDGCQALGFPVGSKVERPYGNGRDVRDIRTGASLPILFELLKSTARPAAERLALLRWVILQILIGNTDAHAKNLTFLNSSGGLSLAPAYDLVCGLIYADQQVEDSYAFAIGDAFVSSELSTYEWSNFSVQTAMKPELVKKELTSLANKALSVLPKVAAEVIAEGARPDIVASIVSQVAAESRRQLDMATDIPRMAKLAR